MNTTSTLLAAALGGGVGLGVLLAVQGLRGRLLLPSPGPVARSSGSQRWLVVAAAALGTGLVVWVVSGWPVAGLGAAAAVAAAPRLMGNRPDRGGEIERVEALATWVEMLRDAMAGAKGLEDALAVTAPAAPGPIAEPLHRFVAGLRHRPLDEALEELGDDLNHPAADLVVAGLRSVARPTVGTGDVGRLLTRLAEAIRDEVRMRLRVEVSRAELRTSSKVVAVSGVVMVLLLIVYGQELLAPYRTLAGQLWLLMILGIWAGAGWMLVRLARLEMPERFTARRKGATP